MIQPTRGHRIGLIQIHTAVLIASGVALFAKYLPIGPTGLTAGRTAFGAIALMLFALATGTSLRVGNRRDLSLLILSGILLATHWFAFFQSIQISSIAVALISTATFPLFTTFLEPLFFHERLRKRDIVTALATCGGLVLVAPGFDLANHVTQGALWGVFAAFAYASLTLLNRGYSRRHAAATISFYQQAVAALCALPFAFAGFAAIPAGSVLHVVGLLIVLGVVFTALAQGLVVASLRVIKAQTVGVLFGLEPVYGSLYAFLLLGEVPTQRTVMGGALIMAAGIWTSLARR
ncbi:MAG: DMT family transporter [Rhizomicrobium sp.]